MQGAEGPKVSAVCGNKVGIQTEEKEGHAHLCVLFIETIVCSLLSFSSPTPFHHLLIKAQCFAKTLEDEKFLS